MAKQTLVKYSPTQAYCVYSDCSEAVAGKDIRIKEEEDAHHLKLVSIEVRFGFACR